MRLSLSLLRSDTDYQFDGTPFPNPLGLNKLTSDARAKTGLGHATLKWDAQWLPQWHSTLTVGTSDEQSLGDYFRISDGAYWRYDPVQHQPPPGHLAERHHAGQGHAVPDAGEPQRDRGQLHRLHRHQPRCAQRAGVVCVEPPAVERAAGGPQ